MVKFLMGRILCSLLLLMTGFVHADTTPIAGVVVAEIDGELLRFAALENEYSIDVRGDVANVTVTQEFRNPSDKPMHARYLFPLRRTAVVHAMTMYVGDEVIRAQIKERTQAKEIFTKAKKAGKAASLLDQHRPNMFTQRIANLMPGQPIRVEIEYSQSVPKIDGHYELVVPLVVGPRFQPAGAGIEPENIDHDEQAQIGLWTFEALPPAAPYSGVHVPSSFTADRVKLQLAIEMPTSLKTITSPTHALSLRHISTTQIEAGFEKGQVQDNKDLVIRYMTQETSSEQVGLLQHWQIEEGGYFSLLIEPPAKLIENNAIPREMVFLLDCSGSMSGQPMNASKAFMRAALKGLRPDDTFRIIRFSDAATEFSSHPVSATPENISRGLRYTAGLSGGGGTVMSAGISQALMPPIYGDRVRNIVFLTDGYIGNELSILRLIETNLRGARLFAYGVGAGVNRYLLDEVSRVGQGFTRYFDPTRDDESIASVAAELSARLQTPVLRNIEVDWTDLPVTDVFPMRIPDLYAGDTVRVTGRYTEPFSGFVELRGQRLGEQAKLIVPVDLEQHSKAPVLRQIWARTAVTDAMQEFVAPPERRIDQKTDDELRARILNLGLSHNLVTRWTSFVAVSEKIYNLNTANTPERNVVLPKVAGTTSAAYTTPSLQGYAAPEPSTYMALLVAFGILWLGQRRRLATRRT
ncbi:MAG: VWA domain-containing protein [Pseudomonadales bacterium]|nr:VWA domain-containing protein [Pseudomonadales bacterium]